jgi:adenylosuccinate lyase
MIARYAPKDLEALFTDESRFNTYLQVEILVLEGWAATGRIPQSEVEAIKTKAKVDVRRINELEAETKHDVVAFTRQISETLGPEKRWVHFGLTSTDVVDTSLAVLYKKADEIIAKDFVKLMRACQDKAIAFKDVPCIGRTHGMQAEITSFGLKWALYFDELQRDYRRFQEARADLETGKISGAVGNFANVPIEVQDYVCSHLGINSAKISTQVLQRDAHAYYGAVLALTGSTMEKIAMEIRLLSQSEIGELEEGFAKGQKGSSAMPQKRNPISSENICGCARILRGYMVPLFEDNALFHERDISHSSVERTVLIDEIELFCYMLRRMKSVIENLNMFPQRMKENIYVTRGAVFAQRILSMLIEKGLTREEAYDLIQPLAMDATLGKSDFRDSLLKSPEVYKHLSDEEVNSAFDEKYYLRNVEAIYKRVGII